MKNTIKPVIYGCLLTIGLGIIGYLAVFFYHTLAIGIDDSKMLVDIIRSKNAMYLSIPYTLVVMIGAIVLVTKNPKKHHMLIGVLIIIITALSITLGPLKTISIHMNYLPIVIGGFIGVLVGKKLNKRQHHSLAEVDVRR